MEPNSLVAGCWYMMQIKNRYTGAVLLEYDRVWPGGLANALLEAAEAGVSLAEADLRGVDLGCRDLKGIDLRGADLRGANLESVEFYDADLRGADFTGASIVNTCFGGAKLEGAIGLPEAPVVPDLDAAILSAVEAAGLDSFNMGSWHDSSACGTTHCRAGWAITLAGDAGKALEDKYGPEIAGGLIYFASTGKIPSFFTSNSVALADMRACAAGAKS